MDVPRHEDDTCIEDTEPPPTVEPESHWRHSDAHSETAHQHQRNQMKQDTVTLKEDAVHNATTTRENRELRHQSKVHKNEHIEQQTRQHEQMQRQGRQDYSRNGHCVTAAG